jgi:hypothetical protein
MTVSDLATPMGAGPWTIVTSAGMAIVGLIAGVLWHRSNDVGRLTIVVGGYLLAVLFDIATSVALAVIYSYPWITSILGLYVPFITGSLSPYPFGFAHEITTAVLCGTIGPSLARQIRKVYPGATG